MPSGSSRRAPGSKGSAPIRTASSASTACAASAPDRSRTVSQGPTRLWGARFRTPPDPSLMRLSRSDASHFRLVPYDLAASRAHARELERAGLLDAKEREAILAGLAAIGAEFAAGRLVPSEADEDVHTFLERALSERLGPLGGKLRAGRSRNDQAANDLKLYLRHEARRLAEDILALQDALL